MMRERVMTTTTAAGLKQKLPSQIFRFGSPVEASWSDFGAVVWQFGGAFGALSGVSWGPIGGLGSFAGAILDNTDKEAEA